jgi:hypothetical protein
LHHSKAKKNEHQNDYEKFPELYLYTDHKIDKNVSGRLSNKTKEALDDDIFFMRKRFRNTSKKLKRDLYHIDWPKNEPKEDWISKRIGLRTRQAQKL